MSRSSKRYATIYPVLLTLLIGAVLISIRYGAVKISIDEMLSGTHNWFNNPTAMNLNERIFIEIRVPRAILTVFVGASLAVGGVLMQAFFRNPIVEPGLIGTSSGAAFGASFYFILGTSVNLPTGEWTLPIAAGLGGILATTLVFGLAQSRHSRKSAVITLLLTGIAINALFMSGVGFLSYIARDPQARSITFWTLGTLSGANWHAVGIVGITTIGCLALALRYTKHLNALMIGEEEAQYLGSNIKRLRITILLINVTMVAVATAFTGVISFIGLIVPHLLRIIRGSDNRFLVIGSALLGGLLLSLADITARLLLEPAELPIGIVTSIIGLPLFIFLLRKNNNHF